MTLCVWIGCRRKTVRGLLKFTLQKAWIAGTFCNLRTMGSELQPQRRLGNIITPVADAQVLGKHYNISHHHADSTMTIPSHGSYCMIRISYDNHWPLKHCTREVGKSTTLWFLCYCPAFPVKVITCYAIVSCLRGKGGHLQHQTNYARRIKTPVVFRCLSEYERCIWYSMFYSLT